MKTLDIREWQKQQNENYWRQWMTKKWDENLGHRWVTKKIVIKTLDISEWQKQWNEIFWHHWMTKKMEWELWTSVNNKKKWNKNFGHKWITKEKWNKNFGHQWITKEKWNENFGHQWITKKWNKKFEHQCMAKTMEWEIWTSVNGKTNGTRIFDTIEWQKTNEKEENNKKKYRKGLHATLLNGMTTHQETYTFQELEYTHS